MALSRSESLGRLLITVPVLLSGIYGLLAGIPFSTITPEQQWWIGVLRASYGALVALRLFRSLPGTALMHGWRETLRVRRIYSLWIIVALLMALGLLTPVAMLLHWWLGATIQRKNRVYSVEDVLFRATGFCVMFMQPHLAFSLDAQLGWTYGLGSSSVIGVNFFMWTVALLMFSAGLEKVWSPLWHKGLGFYYFISLPHLVRPSFAWLNRSRRLSVVLSWITVFSELLLVPAMFIPALRWPLYLAMGGFAVTLFVLVDISFIGQITLLLLVGAAAVDWHAAPAADEWLFQFWSVSDWALFTLLGGLYVVATISSSGLVLVRSGWIHHLMVWTTHFRPFTVFVEIHIYGLYLFRLMARMKDGTTRRILDVFTDKGGPGRLQTWRPRTFQGAMYRFTDYCIAVLEKLEDRRVERARFVEDIAFAGYESLPAAKRAQVQEIEIQVRVFDPADDFEPDTRPWLSPEWQPIGFVRGFPDALELIPGNEPPRYKKTYRWPVKFQ
jgi:hypothetical protein